MAGPSPLLTVQTRSARGKHAKALRRQNKVIGVLYGFKVENTPIECMEKEFHKVYVQAGESTIVDLQLEKKSIPVLIHDIAFDPITGQYTHVDFLALDLTKEVTTHVPLTLTGESSGVKELGGVLVRNRDTLTVRCLPKNLPHAIEVDISSLQNFHDSITVSALRIPANVKIEEKPDEIIASLIPPRKEEEVAPAVTAEAVPAEGAVEGAAAAPTEGAAAAPEGEKEKGGKEKKTGK